MKLAILLTLFSSTLMAESYWFCTTDSTMQSSTSHSDKKKKFAKSRSIEKCEDRALFTGTTPITNLFCHNTKCMKLDVTEKEYQCTYIDSVGYQYTTEGYLSSKVEARVDTKIQCQRKHGRFKNLCNSMILDECSVRDNSNFN